MMQRVVSEMETRLRKLEAELRGEKSERIKRAMQTGGIAQQAMDISDAEVRLAVGLRVRCMPGS